MQDGRERANISFRAFPKDFAQAVAFLESQGEVRSKELREGTGPVEGDAAQPEDPNARIDVSLIGKEPSNLGLIIAIAAPVGGCRGGRSAWRPLLPHLSGRTPSPGALRLRLPSPRPSPGEHHRGGFDTRPLFLK